MRFLNLFASVAAKAPGDETGLPRRTWLALMIAVALVAPAAAILMIDTGVSQAGEDESSGAFWREEARRHGVTGGFGVTMPSLRSVLPADMFAPRGLTVRRSVDQGGREVGRPGVATITPAALRGYGARGICVRLCDGYFFPVGNATSGEADIRGQEAVCSSLCPGAPTRLYLAPAGSDRMEDAVSTADGRPYSALAAAFHHTTARDATCSCKPYSQSAAALVSPLKDFTLRRGDSIMTGEGFRVFRGARHWPWHREDFLSLVRSPDLSAADRTALAAIERVAVAPRLAARSAVSPAQRLREATPARLKAASGKLVRSTPTEMLR